MSRIGNKVVAVPAGVKVQLKGEELFVDGPKGKLTKTFPSVIRIQVSDGKIQVARSSEEKSVRALHGMVRSIIHNMVEGVTNEFSKTLLIEGVGFKAQMNGKILQLSLGFSHPLNYTVPDSVKVEAVKPTVVVVKGIDRELVGKVASDIRHFFEPEPYKGKGVRYSDEVIRRKKGKAVQ